MSADLNNPLGGPPLPSPTSPNAPTSPSASPATPPTSPASLGAEQQNKAGETMRDLGKQLGSVETAKQQTKAMDMAAVQGLNADINNIRDKFAAFFRNVGVLQPRDLNKDTVAALVNQLGDIRFNTDALNAKVTHLKPRERSESDKIDLAYLKEDAEGLEELVEYGSEFLETQLQKKFQAKVTDFSKRIDEGFRKAADRVSDKANINLVQSAGHPVEGLHEDFVGTAELCVAATDFLDDAQNAKYLQGSEKDIKQLRDNIDNFWGLIHSARKPEDSK